MLGAMPIPQSSPGAAFLDGKIPVLCTTFHDINFPGNVNLPEMDQSGVEFVMMTDKYSILTRRLLPLDFSGIK
jgi:hypothetical protein